MMASPDKNTPLGKLATAAIVPSSSAMGALVREQRKHLNFTQADLAGIGNTGNRFIVDLENGKPTVQLQKVLDVLDLLGLELLVRRKTAGGR